MRTLPALVETAKNKAFTRPVTLVKIDLPAHKSNPALTLRLAERGDGGGADFSAAGETWKRLLISFSRTQDQVRPGAGLTGVDASARLNLINVATSLFSPAARLSTIFQNYKPEAGTVTIYQWFDGEGFAASDLLEDFVGRIAAPVEYAGDSLTFDVLSLSNEFGKRHILKPFTRAAYPDLPDSTVGRAMPIPIGQVKKAPCYPVTDTAATVLTTLADIGDQTINVADTTDFPSSGTLLINGNRVNYGGKTATTFTGVSGILEIHYDGAQVTEQLPAWKYLVHDPRFAIGGVDGLYGGSEKYLINAADYSYSAATGLITFASRPRVVLHDNTLLRSVFLDQVDPSNTALDAANAFDFNETDKVATINQAARTLALKQIDQMQDLGPISRVWIQTYHFADGNMNNDQINVEIGGLGVVGNLSRPAVVDKATVSSLVDIDHDNFNDITNTITPSLPGHNSSTDAEKTFTQNGSYTQPAWDRVSSASLSDPQSVKKITIDFGASVSGATKAVYTVSLTAFSQTLNPPATSATFRLGGRAIASVTGVGLWKYEGGFTISGSSHPQTMDIDIVGGSVSARINNISVSRLIVDGTANVSSGHSGAQANIKTGGVFPTAANKTPVNTTLKATNLAWNRIEITSTVLANGGWAWFEDKIIKLVYSGSSDGRSVYVMGVNFEVEYAKQRVEYVDDRITVDLRGIKDDASGTITGTPSALIERPDHVFKWSLDIGVGAQRETALELEEGGTFELEGGGAFELEELDASYIDATTFAAAGAEYASRGYRLAGVMLDDSAIREYWRSWARQCRSVFHAVRGNVFSLFFRPLNGSVESTTTVKSINENSTDVIWRDRLSSVRIRRTPQDEITNVIDLKYDLDYSGDGYRGLASVSDQESIDRYGERTDPARFEFDFVNDAAMAADLAAFYLEENREPFKVATFLAHLSQLELQLFDIIGVQSEIIDGSGGSAKPGLVIGTGRQYGSGVANTPNTFLITARMVNFGFLNTGGFGIQAFGASGFGGQETLD